MDESFDVGVLIHFPEDVSETVKLDLFELADKWDGFADASWPFPVALLPMGDYLAMVFSTPDNANLFISHAERYLQSRDEEEDVERLYSIVLCWSGLMGSGG
jgi:hypothetical protein